MWKQQVKGNLNVNLMYEKCEVSQSSETPIPNFMR